MKRSAVDNNKTNPPNAEADKPGATTNEELAQLLQQRMDRRWQNTNNSPPFRSFHGSDEPHRKVQRTGTTEDPYQRGLDIGSLPPDMRESLLQQRLQRRLRDQDLLFQARITEQGLAYHNRRNDAYKREQKLERLAALNLEQKRSSEREEALRREAEELRAQLYAATASNMERSSLAAPSRATNEAEFRRRHLGEEAASSFPMRSGDNRSLEAMLDAHRNGNSMQPQTPEDEEIARSGARIANLKRLIREEEQNMQLLGERRRQRLLLLSGGGDGYGRSQQPSSPSRLLLDEHRHSSEALLSERARIGLDEQLLYGRRHSISRLAMDDRLQAHGRPLLYNSFRDEASHDDTVNRRRLTDTDSKLLCAVESPATAIKNGSRSINSGGSGYRRKEPHQNVRASASGGPSRSSSPSTAAKNHTSDKGATLEYPGSDLLSEERRRADADLRDQAAGTSPGFEDVDRYNTQGSQEGLSRMAKSSRTATEPQPREFDDEAVTVAGSVKTNQSSPGAFAKRQETSSSPSSGRTNDDSPKKCGDGTASKSPGALDVIPPGQGILLSLPTDKGFVSSYQALIRECLEFSQAQKEDVMWHTQGRKHKVHLGQVGVRCRYCAHRAANLRGRGSVYFPGKLAGVYAAAQNMTTTHLLESCEDIPLEMREALGEERRNQRIHDRRGGGRKYWIESCKKLGLKEIEEQSGIWM